MRLLLQQHESPDVEVALDPDSPPQANTDDGATGTSQDAHLWSLGQAKASTGQPVTCVLLAEEDVVVVGDAAGCTRTYRVSSGEACMTYPRREGLSLLPSDVQPQQPEGAGSGSRGVGSKEAVTALALCTLKVSTTMSQYSVHG